MFSKILSLVKSLCFCVLVAEINATKALSYQERQKIIQPNMHNQYYTKFCLSRTWVNGNYLFDLSRFEIISEILSIPILSCFIESRSRMVTVLSCSV